MKENPSLIKFKLTTSQQYVIQLAYEPNKTLFEYINDLSALYETLPEAIKLVYKGKVLIDKMTAQQAKIKDGTVMVVLNTVRKQPKKIIPSSEQVVKGAGMSTGLGASSPFGIGGYQVVNNPQYMNAISQAVDPDKMEDMLNDPQAQGVLEDMVNDPDTMKQLINNDPMMQSLMKNNPGMKMALQNPVFLKMLFSKENVKKTQEMMKNGGMENLQQSANNFSSSNFLFPTQSNPLQTSKQPNNPLLPNAFPFFNMMPMNGNNQTTNPFQNIFNEGIYAYQLKELQLYGFKDRTKNISVLRQVNGNLDLAIEKLCSQ